MIVSPISLAPAFRHLAPGRTDNLVALTPEISAALAANSVVAVGVSGGKDSDACAIAVDRHLRQIGHTGPRVLIHADLGRIEWNDSLAACRRLAAHLGWELMVVERHAGDMLARWQGRWANNLARYRDLSCVKLILPWSTPAMRFCTSELKVAVITAALKKRFPAQNIINVAGIRRQESEGRRRAPVSSIQPKLARRGYQGLNWNALIEWPIEDVLATIDDAGLRAHEAYTTYGVSRVSCSFCIMSSLPDLAASVTCEGNHAVFRQLVELEVTSTFAFQGNRWLADAAPHLLSDELATRVTLAKDLAAQRQQIEAEIPKHLLYVAGWPTGIPTREEGALIASVRRRLSDLLALDAKYLSGDDVRARYAELLAAKSIASAKKTARGEVGSSCCVEEGIAGAQSIQTDWQVGC